MFSFTKWTMKCVSNFSVFDDRFLLELFIQERLQNMHYYKKPLIKCPKMKCPNCIANKWQSPLSKLEINAFNSKGHFYHAVLNQWNALPTIEQRIYFSLLLSVIFIEVHLSLTSLPKTNFVIIDKNRRNSTFWYNTAFTLDMLPRFRWGQDWRSMVCKLCHLKSKPHVALEFYLQNMSGFVVLV